MAQTQRFRRIVQGLRGWANQSRRQPPTIRRLVIGWFLAVLAGILALSAGFQYVALRHFLLQTAQQRLVADVREALAATGPGAEPQQLVRAVGGPHTAVWLMDAVTAAQPVAAALPPWARHLRPPATTAPVQIGPGPYLWVRVPGGPAHGPRHPPAATRRVLMLAEPLSAVQAVLADEWHGLVVGGLVALLAAGGIGGLLLARALEPLEAVADTADAVAAGDLDRRFARPGAAREVARLGHAFNAMVERLGHALREERQQREQMRRFLADASHELRTPATALLGFLEILSGPAGHDATAIHQSLPVMYGQAQRMAQLVDRLMALARLESAPPTEPTPFSVAAWFPQWLPEWQAMAALAHRQLIVAPLVLPDPPPQLCGDAEALAGAVANLIENATKYSRPRSAIRLAVWGDATGVYVRVSDEGPGIAPSDLPHVFERFYRGHNAVQATGSGLGLAIVQAVVDRFAGHVTIESRPETGTTVTLELPLWPRYDRFTRNTDSKIRS